MGKSGDKKQQNGEIKKGKNFDYTEKLWEIVCQTIKITKRKGTFAQPWNIYFSFVWQAILDNFCSFLNVC